MNTPFALSHIKIINGLQMIPKQITGTNLDKAKEYIYSAFYEYLYSKINDLIDAREKNEDMDTAISNIDENEEYAKYMDYDDYDVDAETSPIFNSERKKWQEDKNTVVGEWRRAFKKAIEDIQNECIELESDYESQEE